MLTEKDEFESSVDLESVLSEQLKEANKNPDLELLGAKNKEEYAETLAKNVLKIA